MWAREVDRATELPLTPLVQQDEGDYFDEIPGAMSQPATSQIDAGKNSSTMTAAGTHEMQWNWSLPHLCP
jgi:hypothetical protein